MKKALVSLLLAVVMSLGASQGVISAFAEAKRDEDTPVAQITNDDYRMFSERTNSISTGTKEKDEDRLQDVLDCVESIGGEVHTYNNEEEYKKSIEKETATASKTIAYADTTTEIRKTIKVLDRNTSKPITNAIVRLNGIPRYTDRNGEIKATLTSSVYELYVEKNVEDANEQYNPHMEFIYLEDEDADTVKTVYLRHPSDDLEIYSVNLRIGYAGNAYAQYFNLLEQEYHFALDYMDYAADIIVETNLTPDYTYLYVNGKLDRMTVGNDFIYFDYNKTNADGSSYYKPGDKFSVVFEYDGIKSKSYDLLLGFTDLNFGAMPEVVGDGITSNGVGLGNDYGLFGNFEFDYNSALETIQDLMKVSTQNLMRPKERHKWFEHFSLKLSSTYNPRENTSEFIFGFEFNMKIDKSSIEKYKEYEEATNKAIINGINIKSMQDDLNDLEYKLADAKFEYEQNDKEWDELVECEERYKAMKQYYLDSGDLDNAKKYEQMIWEGDDSIYSKFKKNYNALTDIVANKNALESTKVKMTEALDGMKKLPNVNGSGNGLVQSKFKVNLKVEVYGTWKRNCANGELISFKVSGSLGITIAHTWQFLVLYFPLYARIEGGFKIGIEVVITNNNDKDKGEHWFGTISLEEFWYFFKVIIEIKLRADVGIGLYDVLSVGGFGEFEIKLKLNIGELKDKAPLKDTEGILKGNIGIKIKILFFKYEFKYPDDVEPGKWEHKFLGESKNSKELSIESRAYKIPLKSRVINFEIETIDSVYQDCKPQYIALDNEKYLLVWLKDSSARDALNRTELVYAVCENGVLGETHTITNDTGCADFYPQLYKSGERIYLAWQRANSKIVESDTLASMAAKGDIWFSEFDLASDSFIDTKRITNDGLMDMAPKFAVSDNGTLTLLWQRNSINDMLGLSGTNSILSSTLTNGKWSAPKVVYSSENIISYVSGAYVNDNLYVSFIEDTDQDVMTSYDRMVKVVNEGTLIYSDAEDVGNTQFVSENGKISLYYLKDQNIVKTDDYLNSHTVITSESGEYNFGFTVVSNDNGTAIFYDTTNGEHKQSYCALYDSVTGDWIKGVQLSSVTDNAVAATGFINQDGSIAYAHVVTDDEESYGAICYGVKQLKYEIQINDAAYSSNLVNGENFKLTVTVSNTGDYEISKLVFELFGQKQVILLESSLKCGKELCFNLEFIADISNGEESTELSVKAMRGEKILAKDSYQFFFGYTDIELNAEIKFTNNVQQVAVLLKNISEYDSIGQLIVYKNGELIATYENISVKKNESKNIEVALQNICKNDNIFVEFVSDKSERNTANNSTILVAVADSIKEQLQTVNPYEEMLNSARSMF